MTVLANWKARLADAKKVLMDALFASCKMKEVTTFLPPLFIVEIVVVWPADGKGQNMTLNGLLLIVFGKQWLSEWTNRFVCLANIPCYTPRFAELQHFETNSGWMFGQKTGWALKKHRCEEDRLLLYTEDLVWVGAMFHVRSCADTSDKKEFAKVCYWQCWSHFWFIRNLALKTKLLLFDHLRSHHIFR